MHDKLLKNWPTIKNFFWFFMFVAFTLLTIKDFINGGRTINGVYLALSVASLTRILLIKLKN